MQPNLVTLLELQEKDRVVMAIEAELDGLRPEVEELDRDVTTRQRALENARTRVNQSAERRQGLEGKIESYRVMQERRRQKLEWVRGAKEASTLMAEIDLARSVMAREEADWLRSADDVQHAETAVVEAEAAVEELVEAQAQRRKEIATDHGKCEKRLKAARKDRDKKSATVEKRALGQYERILSGRAPLALYPLHAGACGHCFNAIPLHLRQQLQQSEGASTCEACGVMVYIAPTA